MEKAKRRVRICLLCVVVVAIVMWILYYYHDLGDSGMHTEGTLISAVHSGWQRLWK